MKHDTSGWVAQDARVGDPCRVLKDDGQAVTKEDDALITRRRLPEYLKRTGVTVDQAARSMGLEPGVLSELIAGRGPAAGAAREAMVRKIDKWVEQKIVTERKLPERYVQTGVAEHINGAARLGCKIGAIVLVTGPAGIGKTMTAQAIAAELPGSLMISIRTVGVGSNAVLEDLATAAGARIQHSARLTFKELEGLLRGTGRLLIIDELHKLAGRQNDDALHTLRDLHDATGCPNLWLGQPNIHRYIMNGRTDFEPLDQVASRIKFHLDLTAVATGTDGGPGLYSVEDIQRWLNAQKIRVTSDAVSFLRALANAFGFGGLRTCDGIVQVALLATRGERPITADVLRSVLSAQRGTAAVSAIEQHLETGVGPAAAVG